MDFNSGDNTFVLFDFYPKSTKAGEITVMVLDTPYEGELYSELMEFWKAHVKLRIQDEAGGNIFESEFEVLDPKHVDYKEGARIRVFLRQAYDRDDFHRIVDLYKHNVKFEWDRLQQEIEFENEE